MATKFKKFIQTIFSVYNKNNHKVVQFFGIKLKFKYKKFSLKKEIEEIKNLELSNRNNINNNADKITNEIIKLKQEICSIKSCLNPCGYLSDFEEMFGRYMTEIPDIGLQLQNLLDCFDNEDKNKILSDLQNNYVRYKSNGKIKFNDLITTETKLAIEKRDKYMAQKVNKDGYWQLDNYKLPVDFFLSEVLYTKLGLDDLNKEVFKNRDIIDAGACIGDSALVLSEYTNKNVYAFEPGEKNFKLMEKTIQLNDKKNIIPIMCGLGDKEEALFLNENYDSNNIGGAYIADENIKNAETAYIIPLDKYVKENNLDIGLIKIDVEGFEQNVLNGSYETIKKCRPTLIISIYHKPDDFFEIAPMIKQWNLGYKFKFMPQYSYNNFLTETTVIAEPILN